MATISIIVPLYNKESYIGLALESLLEQSFTDFEALIIDDGSSDKSRLMVEEFIARRADERFSLISRENRGVSETINEGMALVANPYFGVLNADDLMHPRALEQLHDLATHYEADIASSQMREISLHADLDSLPKSSEEHRDTLLSPDEAFKRLFVSYNGSLMSMCTKLYRTDFVRSFDLKLNPELSNTEDFHFNAHCFAHAERIAESDFVSYFYRSVPNSLSRGYRSRAWEAVDILYREFLKSELSLSQSHEVFKKYEKEILEYLALYYTLSVMDEDIVKDHARDEGLPSYNERIKEYFDKSHYEEVFVQIEKPESFVKSVFVLARTQAYSSLRLFSRAANLGRAIRRKVR